MTTAIPFSNAWRVRICRGSEAAAGWPPPAPRADSAALSAFSASSAAMVEEPGRLMPMASNAEDIVLAVNIPPHEPLPGAGVALDLEQLRARRCVPALNWPTASKTLTTVRSRPCRWPGLMVPP